MASVRIADDADIPTIQSIAHTTWPVTFGGILSPAQIGYMLHMMYCHEALAAVFNGKNQLVLIAEDEKHAPVGFSAIEFSYKELASTKIHKLYLIPSVQGKGIGKLLIKEISGYASDRGDTSLTLNVNKFNENAIAFYQKNGFQKVREEIIPIGSGYYMDDFVMVKTLS
jgi:ribosomal protein S18 acetylase RimI-like enzyme